MQAVSSVVYIRSRYVHTQKISICADSTPKCMGENPWKRAIRNQSVSQSTGLHLSSSNVRRGRAEEEITGNYQITHAMN